MALKDSTYADFDAINAANKAANTDNRFKSGSKDTVAESKDTFLKLLTTQLQNQDPLNPMDNAQMTSQLAQISTVDGITKLNATLQSMFSSVADSQTLQAAALVNRVVLVPGKGLMLHEKKSAGGVELEGPADRVTVNIADANGLPVRLALTAGEAHDNRLAGKLLSRLKSGSMLLADRGCDADWIRALAARKGARQHSAEVRSQGTGLL